MGPGCFTCCLCLCLCLCLFLSARIGHLGLQAREAAGRRRDLMLQEERSRREANTFFAAYVSRVILILTKLLHGFKWFYFVQIVRNSFCFRYRIFIYAVRNFLGFTDFKWNNLKPCRRWTNQFFFIKNQPTIWLKYYLRGRGRNRPKDWLVHDIISQVYQQIQIEARKKTEAPADSDYLILSRHLIFSTARCSRRSNVLR